MTASYSCSVLATGQLVVCFRAILDIERGIYKITYEHFTVII